MQIRFWIWMDTTIWKHDFDDFFAPVWRPPWGKYCSSVSSDIVLNGSSLIAFRYWFCCDQDWVTWWYLNNDLRLHVSLSYNPYFRLSVRLHIHPTLRRCVYPYVTLPFFPIPSVVAQNLTNESSLACIESEKYVVCVTLSPFWSIRRGEAELRTLQ